MSPPRPPQNDLGRVALWVPEARHGTDARYCALYIGCKAVPSRIETGQQVHLLVHSGETGGMERSGMVLEGGEKVVPNRKSYAVPRDQGSPVSQSEFLKIATTPPHKEGPAELSPNKREV